MQRRTPSEEREYQKQLAYHRMMHRNGDVSLPDKPRPSWTRRSVGILVLFVLIIAVVVLLRQFIKSKGGNSL